MSLVLSHQVCRKHKFIIHSAVCLTIGPQPLPKRVLHTVQSSVSYFNFQYPLVSLTSTNSCLCLLPCLPFTSTPPSIFPSIIRFRRQFLRKMCPTQLAFLLFIVCRIFLSSSTQCNTSHFSHDRSKNTNKKNK